MTEFDYHRAFSSNIGWLTPEELEFLRTKTVAIAGLGGAGGAYAITLARLGIGNFNLSDPDEFELHNFNRQAGAMISTLGKSKIEVIANMILDINPSAKITSFQKIDAGNVDDFISRVDIYADSIDVYEVDTRVLLFDTCEKYKKPAVTAAPLGMGCAFTSYMPGGMGFETYFCLRGKPLKKQIIMFLAGLSPRMLQRTYLMVKNRFDIEQRKSTSTPMGIDLSVGIASTEILKILLNRGKVYSLPYTSQFDAYVNKYVRCYLRWGNQSLLQRLKIRYIEHLLNK